MIRCDGCGHDAIEVLVFHEDDWPRCTLRYCRACAEDHEWSEPGAEIEVSDEWFEQLAHVHELQ